MTAAERHLTALDLDGLDLDDAEPGDRQRIHAHIKGCVGCAARRSEHEQHLERFRAVVFPRTVDALSSHRRRGPKWLRVLALGLPAVAGVVLLARAWAPRPGADNVDIAPRVSVKGDAFLHVFARRGGGPAGAGDGLVVRVTDGERLAAGDALRFVIDPTGLPHVLIASVDGAGQVSIYYPFRGQTSAAVDGSASFAVPGSIVLDAAPGPERLFAICSKRPLDARIVRAALERTAAGGPSAIRTTQRLAIEDSVQASLVFEKEPAR